MMSRCSGLRATKLRMAKQACFYKNKQTHQNMSSFNVLSENENLHIIGKVQADVSILL